MKDYIVYSLRLANILTNKGYQIKRVGINKNNPKYNIYFFEDTAQLREVIKDFKSNPYQ